MLNPLNPLIKKPIGIFAVNINGSLETEALGDYSGGIVCFGVFPPKGTVINVKTIQVLMGLNNANNFEMDGYGGSSAPLTTGVIVRVQSRHLNFTSIDIKTNWDYMVTSSDLTELPFKGTTKGYKFTTDYTSIDAEGLYLDGENGDFICFDLNDDFSGLGLLHHQFILQGGF